MELKFKDRYGNLKEDRFEKILNHYCVFKDGKGKENDGKSNEKIKPKKPLENCVFKVEWATRPDGVKPIASYFTYQNLKANFPVKLLEYLENLVSL
jgi:hypothetical protein